MAEGKGQRWPQHSCGLRTGNALPTRGTGEASAQTRPEQQIHRLCQYNTKLLASQTNHSGSDISNSAGGVAAEERQRHSYAAGIPLPRACGSPRCGRDASPSGRLSERPSRRGGLLQLAGNPAPSGPTFEVSQPITRNVSDRRHHPKVEGNIPRNSSPRPSSPGCHRNPSTITGLGRTGQTAQPHGREERSASASSP